MDVTPTNKMHEFIMKTCDAVIGPAPGKLETTPAAERRREARENFIAGQYTLIRLAMREGVARDRRAQGLPVEKDQIIPAAIKGQGMPVSFRASDDNG
jgi:hypothetical protein